MQLPFPRLASTEDRSPTAVVNRFLHHPGYPALVSVLTLVSAVFSLEVPVYFFFILAGIYICLFAEDLLGLMPLVLNAYMTVSVKNNPGLHQSTIFSPDRWGIVFIGMVAALVVALVIRLVFDPELGGKHFLKKKRSLLPGMVILGIAYCLGGLGSKANMSKNLLFAGMQFATIIVPYYVFSGGIKWDRCRRDYFGWIGFCTGIMLLFQLGNIYRVNDVIVNGSIDRDQIFNGWSMYNNLGILLAMMIPSAFYLSSRYRKGWLGSLAAAAFLLGAVLCCSRNSILMGACAFVLCVFVSLSFSKNKKANFWAIVISVGCGALAVILFQDQLRTLFKVLFDIGTDNNSRYMTYRYGIAQWKDAPIFGGSFYPQKWFPFDWSSVDSFSSFFPPRWHNTIVQLLASCGVVGLVAYLYHRLETIRLFLHNRTREKAFIACMILTLLGGSLLDCHFFNIGPVLFYSAGLAFAEYRIKKL